MVAPLPPTVPGHWLFGSGPDHRRRPLELYAEAFDSVGRIDRLEGFASDFGADFYGLPRNATRIRLAKRAWTPPANYSMGGENRLVPMRAGESISWKLLA